MTVFQRRKTHYEISVLGCNEQITGMRNIRNRNITVQSIGLPTIVFTR